MKKEPDSPLWGIFIVLVLIASTAIAGEKDSSEDVLKQFFKNQKTPIETVADDPAAMKDYVSSVKDVNAATRMETPFSIMRPTGDTWM
jgi:hypothetical protein